MALKRITAAEAARFVKNGDNVGLSGFTPAGTPKAVTHEIGIMARELHEKGQEFQINLFTGASTGDSCDGILSREQAIRFRAPYTTNEDFRAAVNRGEIAYNDVNLSCMAQELRYGFYGKLNIGILEAFDITDDGKIWVTAGVGIAPTVARLADKLIVELNAAHARCAKGLHDIYELTDPPYRREVLIYKPDDCIGKDYIQVDPSKILGVVEVNIRDEARDLTAPNEITLQIAHNVAQFLISDLKRGVIPSTFLPLQSGVGNVANAVLGALGEEPSVPPFQMYTEVIQDSVIDLLRKGHCTFGSASSLSVTLETLDGIYDDMEFFKGKLVLRPTEISNNPEVVRRLGLIAMNTALEADIYGNVNSTHVGGTRMMNGVGGSADFTRNSFISIFSCPSEVKGGKISAIVPMCTHVDHNEHSVNVIITEQGIADLRGKSPAERAKTIIENCVHPDYKQLMWDYLKVARKGHTSHALDKAFALHKALAEKGDMRLAEF